MLAAWASLERESREKLGLGSFLSPVPGLAWWGQLGTGQGVGVEAAGYTVALLGIELLLLVRLLVCDACLLGFLQHVAALILHVVN
jgi:hypothetical protein